MLTWWRVHETLTLVKELQQLRNAKRGRDSLDQGRAHCLVIPYQWSALKICKYDSAGYIYVFRDIDVHTNTYIHRKLVTTFFKKRQWI